MLEDLWFRASRLRHDSPLRHLAWLWAAVTPLWHAVMGPLTARRGLFSHVNGETFRLEAQFASPYGRHRPRAYEPIPYAAFLSALKPGMHVVDVGAHIGLYTLGAARRIGTGKVYAFEPNAQASSVLHRHVGMNGLDARVEVVTAAVSDTPGVATFYSSGVTTAASLAQRNVQSPLNREALGSPVREASVPTVALDEFFASRRLLPDVLKIDAEGAELMVLRGLRRVMSEGSPLVICEVHPEQMKSFDTSVEELWAFTDALGYSHELLDTPTAAGTFHVKLVRADR